MKVTVEKLIFGGQGLARQDSDATVGAGGKVIFVWGALPGEEVEIEVLKGKKNFVEGIVRKVLKPSPHRVEPIDEHYESCSPWQTMSFDEENKWKKEIALETYRRNGNLEISNNVISNIVSDGTEYGYRNKMEYNFVFSEDNKPHLAFHYRGTHRLRPIVECKLATTEIQKGSSAIIEWLGKQELPFGALKSLIVRSDTSGKVAAALFLKKPFTVKTPPPIPTQIFLSDYRSPASVPTELLATYGDTALESTVNGVKMQFGLLSFFQINAPVFEKALEDISKHIDGGRVVDYYCGVGAISLALYGKYGEALLVEENKEAAHFARINIELNKYKNVSVVHSLAEKADAEILASDTVILDPPRTGLHKNVVEKLLASKPKKIIYLSCGIDTQARDIAMLAAVYKPIDWKLYNFFPRTPHIEGLCVLERSL